MEIFRFGFLSFRLVDLFQTLALSWAIYKILERMKGTRSAQLLAGLALVVLAGFLSYALNLELWRWLFSNVTIFGLLALVIILQPEIRTALANFGLAGNFRAGRREQERVVEEVSRAAARLAELKYGGLIIIERRVGLREVIESGKELNARLSFEALVTLFTPYTPLHDGAVIVSQGRIAAAACALPLTQNALYRKLYGMRHKAGIGVTEETDAVAVIVSEETGAISIAQDGVFSPTIDRHEVRDELIRRMKS